MNTSNETGRQWYQFSIREYMLLLVIAAFAAGWLADRQRLVADLKGAEDDVLGSVDLFRCLDMLVETPEEGWPDMYTRVTYRGQRFNFTLIHDHDEPKSGREPKPLKTPSIVQRWIEANTHYEASP